MAVRDGDAGRGAGARRASPARSPRAPAPRARGGRYTAVRDTTLAVAPGEFVSVVGPTGCGKSTLLNVAAGLLAPSAGSVDVFGEPLAGINRACRLHVPGRCADAVAQRARQRHRGARVPRRRRSDDAAARAREWLARVGLAGFEDRYPHQLSGGMRKRVALAQMLILDPQILLMDEPFSALDIQTRQLMENELLELWSANRKSVLFITHDLEEAISLSDRVDRAVGGPATHPIGEFAIDLPRPRDVAEIRMTPRFVELHERDLARDEGRSAEGLCAKPPAESRATLALYHVLLLGAVFAFWYVLTTPGLVSEEFAKNTAFFFGKPLEVLKVIWVWFASGKIYPHLAITLVETLLAFAVGSVLGLVDRAVARAVAARLRARRSLHQGDERDAARDPRADLRRVVRARHHVEGRARRHARVLHRVLQRLSRA